MTITTAYLCLGSNIKPKDNIRFAVRRLKRDFEHVIISNVYRNSAVGFEGADFLNLALSLTTALTLDELLDYTDALEQEAGRVRAYRGCYDSRTLDVDVVMFGDLHGVYEGREWPSDDIQGNAHVLLPMSEIAGNHKHPVLGVKFSQLWKEFDQQGQTLQKIDQLW